MNRYLFAIAVLLLTSLAPGMASAPWQKPGQAHATQRESAYPSSEHAWLGDDQGEWAIHARIWRPGSDVPMEVQGESTMRMLWGRYLQETFVVGEGPHAMEGIGLTAFDEESREFKSVYCLNTGTSLSLTTGRRSEGGEVLILEDDRGRSVITRKSKAQRILEYFTAQADGERERRFTMTYTRKERER